MRRRVMVATGRIRMALLLGIAAGLAPALPAEAWAQAYDSYSDYSPGTESFVDEYGNIVTVDAYGRVVAVEPAPRGRAGGRGEGWGGAPPPGVWDEPAQSEESYAYGGAYERWPGDERLESSPLPPVGSAPDGTTTGSIAPGDGFGSFGSPGAGQPMYESRPAPTVAAPVGENARAQVAALQVLLDRAGISPGVIDGKMGGNVNKAVAAYAEMTGGTIDATDPQFLLEELHRTGGPAVVDYTITNEDVGGPYVASIPSDYGEKALLPAMSYERVSEMLAERFHMDETYLREINPGADFTRSGTILKVMATGGNVTTPVTRVVADKGREQVRAYGADGRLVAAYPATIGSTATPSPSGTVEVSRIAINPNYTYNPRINFQQGENTRVLTIQPGPNGPVGTVWIALSKPTYGIHGTPEPSQIGKTNSHGCVRLTNWDAEELAKLVTPGVTVEFLE